MHQSRPPSRRGAFRVRVERKTGVLSHVVVVHVLLEEAVDLDERVVAAETLVDVELLVLVEDAAGSAGASCRYQRALPLAGEAIADGAWREPGSATTLDFSSLSLASS